MISTHKFLCPLLLPGLLTTVILLSACNPIPNIDSSIHINIPANPVLHTFDLSARQKLRDINGAFSVQHTGADTGIFLVPSEKVEIFASGLVNIQADGKPSGPEGAQQCSESALLESALPCYSVIYSIGITGRAGEVGKHVGFTPRGEGNLFLGVNAINVAANAGSFHISVLVIPNGHTAGMWTTPENGFLLHGTATTLSALVFVQNVVISSVQFTATTSGQAPVPICNALPSSGDTYSCLWNFSLNGQFLHNGPVTLGFVLNGMSQSGNILNVNPDGVRTGIIRYTFTQDSTYYAGYAATNFSSHVDYKKVVGNWTVPSAHCAAGETSLSAIWVGMTSGASNKSLLAQLGTDSDCQNGAPSYNMWWEMFPAPTVPLGLSVQPGDHVTASVVFQSGAFQLTVGDPARGTHFATTQAGKASDTRIAECITEAPTIIDNLATNQGHIAQLTNFGKVSIQCQLDSSLPIADGPQNILYQMTTGNVTKATTSDLDQAGNKFTVQWYHS